MSIINDMLKDLDTRRVRETAPNDSILLGLAVTGETNRVMQKTLTVVAAVCILVMLAAFIHPYATEFLDRQGAISLQHSGNVQLATPAMTQADLPAPSPEEIIADYAAPTPIATIDEYLQNEAAGDSYTSTAAAVFSAPAIDAGTTSSVIKHVFTDEERVQRNYQQALLALGDGNDRRAEALLDETISLDSTRHESRLLLAKLQIRQQREVEAEATLAAGLVQYPQYAPYATLYAQLLVEQMRYTEAAHQLETALPGAARDAEFHALLAGLYQRTGRAMDSARHYQLALQLAPEKGEWWMGLGISLEQSGSRVNAYAAYRRALRYLQSPALKAYVNTRVSDLSRMRGPG